MKAGAAAGTAILEVKTIRTALNAARRKGLIPANPAEAVELPEADTVERGTYSTVEVKLLVDAAEAEWKTLILLAYYTGVALSDCCRMGWTDIDLTGGKLSYTRQKTGHKIIMPLHPELHAHLEAIAGTDQAAPFIMPHKAAMKTSGRRGLSESFKRIAERASSDAQTVQSSGHRKISKHSFHALRHSFTSALANAGVAPELRMKLTGHKSAAVHQGYTHHELETLRAAIGKLPALHQSS